MDFATKYGEIIKEECNIKNIQFLSDWNDFKMIIKPIGSKLKEKFWSDTWKIIGLAKAWNVKILDDQVQVFDWENSWTLEKWEYEIEYQWIDEKTMSAWEWIVIELDLNLTPELIDEWVAREISRTINQLRKDANFDVSDRVESYFVTSESEQKIIQNFAEFLSSEGLLKSINYFQPQEFDIQWDYKDEEKIISIYLKK